MIKHNHKGRYFILFPYAQFVRGMKNSVIHDLFDSKVYWFRGKALSDTLTHIALGRPIKEIMDYNFIPKEELKGYLDSLKLLGVGDYSPSPFATELYRPWALDSQVKKSGLKLQGGTLTLEITNECIYDCQWCASKNHSTVESCGCRVSREKGKKLSLAKIIESIKLLSSIGFDKLVISGGEPFLQRERLFSLLEVAAKLSMRCEVHTTGCLIKKEDIKRLRRSNIKVILMVAASSADKFDGKVRRNFSFKALRDTMKHLRVEGIKFGAKIPASINYEGEAIATADWVLSQGATDAKFLLYGEPDDCSLDDLRKVCAPSNPSELSVGLRQFMVNSQRHACFHNSLFIGFDGSVKPCPGWKETFATLAQEDMSTILWNGFLSHFSNTSRNDVAQCSGCEFRFGCSACLVRTIEQRGSMDSRHWLCNYEPDKGSFIDRAFEIT